MGLRKRLRKRGYVLMSDKRATSVIDLRKRLDHAQKVRQEYGDEHWGLIAQIEEMETGKLGVSMDVMKVKYEIAIERIAEYKLVVDRINEQEDADE